MQGRTLDQGRILNWTTNSTGLTLHIRFQVPRELLTSRLDWTKASQILASSLFPSNPILLFAQVVETSMWGWKGPMLCNYYRGLYSVQSIYGTYGTLTGTSWLKSWWPNLKIRQDWRQEAGVFTRVSPCTSVDPYIVTPKLVAESHRHSINWPHTQRKTIRQSWWVWWYNM